MVLVCGELALAHGMAATPTPAPADAGTPANPAPKVSDLFPDEVVAKGKGVSIKRSQLDDAMVSIKSTFAARGQDLPPEEMNNLEQQVLFNAYNVVFGPIGYQFGWPNTTVTATTPEPEAWKLAIIGVFLLIGGRLLHRRSN